MINTLCTLKIYYLLAFKIYKLFHYLQSSNWYFSILEKWTVKININKSQKILEAGCGPGTLTKTLHEKGYDIHGIDISEKMIEKGYKLTPSTKNRNILSCQDIENTSFDNNTFDHIIAASIINVVKDPEKMIKEILRITKINGKISFLYPTDNMNTESINIHMNKNNFKNCSRAALTTWAKLSNKISDEKALKLLTLNNIDNIEFHTLFDGMVSSITATKMS